MYLFLVQKQVSQKLAHFIRLSNFEDFDHLKTGNVLFIFVSSDSSMAFIIY